MMKRLGTLWLWMRKDSEPSEPQDKVQISADNWDLLPDFAELNNEGRSYAQLLDSSISLIEERENCARGKLTNEDMWRTNTFQDSQDYFNISATLKRENLTPTESSSFIAEKNILRSYWNTLRQSFLFWTCYSFLPREYFFWAISLKVGVIRKGIFILTIDCGKILLKYFSGKLLFR